MGRSRGLPLTFDQLTFAIWANIEHADARPRAPIDQRNSAAWSPLRTHRVVWLYSARRLDAEDGDESLTAPLVLLDERGCHEE